MTSLLSERSCLPRRRFLEMPTVSFHVIENSEKLAWKPARLLAGLLSEVRPRILHLYFTGFLSPYPWTARWNGVEKSLLHRPELASRRLCAAAIFSTAAEKLRCQWADR